MSGAIVKQHPSFQTGMCVCVKRLNRRKTSLAAYFIHIYLWQGITGVPGGWVIDEDTSPGPV